MTPLVVAGSVVVRIALIWLPQTVVFAWLSGRRKVTTLIGLGLINLATFAIVTIACYLFAVAYYAMTNENNRIVTAEILLHLFSWMAIPAIVAPHLIYHVLPGGARRMNKLFPMGNEGSQ